MLISTTEYEKNKNYIDEDITIGHFHYQINNQI
jgi:hypothetical protein